MAAAASRLSEGRFRMEDSILIVDDEPGVISALRRIFLDDPYRIYSAGNAHEALEILGSQPVKVVLSDERMPGMAGSELLSIVRRDYPDIIRIMLTGNTSIDTAVSAVNEGEIYRFFVKPWNDIDLRFAMQAAIDRYNFEEEKRRLLAIVRQQAINFKLLEIQFPGITRLDRDEDGRIMLPDISEDELARIINQCEQECM